MSVGKIIQFGIFCWYFDQCRKKTESIITKKDEQSQQLAMKIQEMQSAMQKAAVEAAKAAAQQAAA